MSCALSVRVPGGRPRPRSWRESTSGTTLACAASGRGLGRAGVAVPHEQRVPDVDRARVRTSDERERDERDEGIELHDGLLRSSWPSYGRTPEVSPAAA